MNDLLKWYVLNGKWIFSGIGVFVISLLVGWMAVRKHSQVIKENSSGIQAGRDVNITNNGKQR